MNSKSQTAHVEQVRQEIICEYYRGVQSEKLPKKLWHYTSVDGLLGIFRNEAEPTLRFTDIRFLNDISEGEEIKKIFENVCSELKKKGEISDEFYRIAIKTKPFTKRVFRNGNENIVAEYQSFVCCFSKEGDSLDLWRYYSKGESGFSLGISEVLVGAIQNKDCHGRNVRFFEVVYDENEKRNIIEGIVKKAYGLYSRAPSLKDEIQGLLSYYLSVNKLKFKNKCFLSERECRIVVEVPVGETKSGPKIMFRAGDCGLTPYFEETFSKYFVQEIKAGPPFDKTKIVSLERFCEEKDLGCRCSCSQLPVRF